MNVFKFFSKVLGVFDDVFRGAVTHQPRGARFVRFDFALDL